MKTLRFTIISLLLVILASCANRNLTLINEEDSQKTINIIGVSMLPPEGNGWHYEIVHPARIQFGRIGTYFPQTIAASVVLHKIPVTETEEEFLIEVSKERWSKKDEQNRFTNVLVEENISHEKNTLCVRYHTIYQDLGSKYLKSKNQYFLIEDIGLICRHPENEKIGVSVGISQRSMPGRTYKKFKTIANAFISNAKFEKLPEE